jgi:uncharacterized DUF497 family protein
MGGEQQEHGMKIADVIWLDDIVEKIETKHGVETWEVEEVLHSEPEFRRGGKARRDKEHLYYALGQTEAGRHLFIVFIPKHGNKALVLTARDMSEREKKGYRRRKRHV